MAKLKDGFYKLTASSVGSNLHVLLAGGGAKPISDFASSFNVKLWGLDFDGSRDVNGQIISNVADGTAPLTVVSTTKVNNLNADFLDNYHASNFYLKGDDNYNGNGVSLSTINTTPGNTYVWNSPNIATLKLSASNNSMVFIVGGVTNDRNALILVGHNESSTYSENLGNLYLNKFGGKVYIGTTEAATINSNVASATKLQTPRTIWGQSFDGTTNISGLITIGLNLLTDPTILFFNGEFIDGYGNIKMSKDTNIWSVGHKDTVSSGVGLFVQALGNVGIGTNIPNAKLHVNGHTIINKRLTIGLDLGTYDSNRAELELISSSGQANDFWLGSGLRDWSITSRPAAENNTLNFHAYVPSNNTTPLVMTLYKSGDTTIYGNLHIGKSDTRNYIAFRGTTGDSPGYYNHTYIGENLWGSSESSELVLYKGNDIASTAITPESSGADRIRHIAAGHLFQIYKSALSGTFEGICTSTVPVNMLAINLSDIRTYAPLVIIGSQYNGSYGINMQNSNIVGVNAIFTSDNAEDGCEGLLFARDNGYYDSIWASGGTLFFSPNGNLNLNGSYGANYTVLHTGNYSSILDGRYYTESEADSRFVNVTGDTMTGPLHLAYATSATMTTSSTNPQIIFSENGGLKVLLMYTDYDSYRSPAGLKVLGELGGEWFEVAGEIYSGSNILAVNNFGINSTAGGGRGISLYGGSGYVSMYGIAFNQTSNWGTHGYVTGDWATYFTMSSLVDRGWIFRAGSNRFSIDGDGHAYANGLVNANYFNSRVATGTQPYQCASTTCNTNLNADLLDGYHRSNLYASSEAWFSAVGLTKSITVTGDSAYWYPVVITCSSDKQRPTFISIWKDLGSTTPSISGNHSNGTSSLWLQYEMRKPYWDGNGGYLKTWYKYQGYGTLVAHTKPNTSATGLLIVWLRGGTCLYYISCTNSFSVNVYYSSTNITGSSSYPDNVDKMSTVGNGGIYTSTYLGYGDISGNATTATTAATANNVVVNNSDSNSTYRMVWHSGNTLYGTGGIYCNPFTDCLYASHYYETSDIAFKTNIKPIINSDNIPVLKSFDWKSDGSHSYGLIALELEAMGYPELVSEGDEGTKTVNYSAALSLIVGKLQVKIKELEKEIEILKNKN